ncbi:MAG: N-acetyltransferase [Ignavibacteria bacterium]|nr:N-acetyltransferase [Ignavibacteria bacterium]
MNEFKDNAEKKRFELITDGFISFIEYTLSLNQIIFTHTVVPDELKGKGIGSLLVKLALENINERNLKLKPLCPFTALYIKRHPEWSFILAVNT